MKNFSKAFTNELIKVNSNYKLLKVSLVILALFIIITLSYSFIIDNVGDYMGGIANLTPQELDIKITMLEEQLASPNFKESSMGLADTSRYSLESQITFLKYVRDNNVNLANKTLFGQMGFDSAGYISSIMDIASTILVVFASIMVVYTFHKEKSNGTLKMQMIRPVSRNTALFARMLSIWTMSLLLFFLFTILAQIVGVIKFGTRMKDVIYVLNGKTAGEMSYIAYMAIDFLVKALQIWFYMQLAYFVSSLLWKKESVMGLTIALILLGPMLDELLNFVYIGYIGFFNNLDFMLALGVSVTPHTKGANLYSMLIITIVYQVLMTVYSFWHFNKCDIV